MLISLYIYMAFFAARILALKFNLQLLANTYEDSTFNNYGLAPIYQNNSDFEGLVFLLGAKPVTFLYDNETQIITYTEKSKTYQIYILNGYLVGLTEVDSGAKGVYDNFMMNMDGTLWVTQINNNVGNNLFYTYPSQSEVYNHKTYYAAYLLEDKTQKLDTQLFTIIYSIVGNSTNPILPYSNLQTATNITTISLLNSTATSISNASAVNGVSSSSGVHFTSTVVKTATRNGAATDLFSLIPLISTLMFTLLALF